MIKDNNPQERYTRGPWNAQRLQADGTVIKTGGWEITTPAYDVVANIERGAPIRKQTDARLIAAAPELLEALRKAVHELNTIRARDGVPWTGVPIPMKRDVCEQYFSSVVDEGFAAIRKAESYIQEPQGEQIK